MGDTKRNVLVTGAGSGLGHAIASRFRDNGDSVIGLDRSPDLRDSVIEAVGDQGSFVALDLGDQLAVLDGISKLIAETGPIDVLVNCAGIRDIGDPLELTLDEWQRVLDVNLTGPFLLSQTVGRTMVERKRGSIVNIASIAGFFGFANRVAYTTSKHALLGLTRVLAASFGPHGVRVNAVCPGMIETPLTSSYVREPNVAKSMEIVVPLGRHGYSREIAEATFFLASDEASFVNGVSLPVDGGFTASATYDVSGASPTFVKRHSVISE